MSVYMLFFAGSVPLGNLLVGWLSGLVGASIGLLICAMLSLAIAAIAWTWRKPAEKDLAESTLF
jgi:membrane protein implicated in regulation of membrane protease activity